MVFGWVMDGWMQERRGKKGKKRMEVITTGRDASH